MRRFLRFAFALLYNQLAFAYDLVSWLVSAGQWRAWQRTALPFLPGPPVLEIAHGTGNLLLDLAGLGLAPIGLDLSPAMSRLASRKLRRRLGGPALPVPLVRASVAALPFAGQSLASLVSTFPTEFLVQPPVIAEFFRVLRPGGAFVCVPAAQVTGPALFDRWSAWLFRITGQSATGWFEPVVQRFNQAGFQARLQQVRLPRSRVMLIVAQKPGPGQPPAPPS
jgi:ubiquinone/menaquinone biosynthesis C-methylase UbiE